MKYLYLLSICLIQSMMSFAQTELHVNTRTDDASLPFDEALAPFYHGVASGDPLTDAVIIWTRVTPTQDEPIDVNWEMASDTAFTNIVASGTYTTDNSRDYTVKIDVTGLQDATTYYYRFTALGANSIIGRTRTATAGASDHLRFSVVSCNNYQSGYFTAFEHIANRNDLDAVLHLGDFIYEYATGQYGYKPNIGRGHLPEGEILDVSDYRIRYSYYRLENELRRAMQQHPFIHIWDDHEVANDSWQFGAQNHNEGEGDYADRKNAATQALFEWVPIRENATQTVYRNFEYGDLADVIMLDTRHEARTEQAITFDQPDIADPSRYLLGETQMNWFKNELSTAEATWKVIGNQIVFAPLLLDEIEAALFPGAKNLFLDTWYGYPTKRDEIINYIEENNINNTVFVTGDVHIALGFDIDINPADSVSYTPSTGEGAIAVEFVTPSISSDNYDELVGETLAAALAGFFPIYNVHNKYIDVVNHGYFILDLTPEKAQADYFFLSSGVATSGSSEYFAKGIFTNVNENHLNNADTPAEGKLIQEIPAPDPTLITAVDAPASLLLLSVYPNPFEEYVMLHYALSKSQRVGVNLYDSTGRLLKNVLDEHQISGNYDLRFRANDLPTGTYFLQINTEDGTTTRQLIKAKK